MPTARCRGEFRMVLAAEEPGMVRELHHLAQVLARGARRYFEPRCFEPRQIMVVDLVAMAMPLVHDLVLMDAIGQRVALHLARLRAQAHGPAQVGPFIAPLDPPVPVST